MSIVHFKMLKYRSLLKISLTVANIHTKTCRLKDTGDPKTEHV